MKHLIKPMTKNHVDNLVDALVENLKYCDSNIEYPDIDKAEPDDGVIAEWFYLIYNGTNDFSELTAIHMYTSQETEFEEIGQLMLGIGLTEMKHFAKIGEMIKRLGGKIDQRYNNSGVAIGKTTREALEIAYNAEIKTIKFYESLSEKIEKVKSTKTTEIALQLISKLIADENIHKKLLEDTLSEFTKEQEFVEEKNDNISDE